MGFGGGFSRRRSIVVVSGSDGDLLHLFQDRRHLIGDNNLTFSGSTLSLTGNLNVQGNVSASNLIGSGSTVPGGQNQQIQYNNNGAFDGAPFFTFNNQNGNITMPTTSVSGNLTVSGSVMPPGNASFNLGTDNLRWADIYASNVYTGDFHLKNERGDWTIFEEREHLTVKNNLTGEEFKLMLEKIKK
jgi:hypothetical protein